MEDQTYKVVFSGVTDPDKDRADIASQFAHKARLSAERVDKVFSTGKPARIKSGLSEENAYTLKAKLDALGMQVSVVPEPKESTPSQTLELVPKVDAAPDVAVPPGNAEQKELTLSPIESEDPASNGYKKPAEAEYSCPKCGKEQVELERCVACGVLFSKLPASADTDIQRNSASPAENKEDAPGFLPGLLGNAKGLFGLFAGLGALLLLLLKKLGFLKVFVAAASLSYAYDAVVVESITMCLGDSQCEAIVNDTAEDCWESSGMDQYDWDSMSDREFERRYEELETSFFSCLTYPDGRNLFLEPAYLTAMLADFCGYEENCMRLADHQQQLCYEANELGLYADQLTNIGQAGVFEEYKKELNGFLQCFVDEKDEQLFSDQYFDFQ